MGHEEMVTPAPAPKTGLARYSPLSKLAGVKVSPIALGGASLGDKWAGAFGKPMSKDETFELLDSFYSAGGNFIDTANNYQDGQSEERIGEWLAARGNRDNVVLSTKFSLHVGPFDLPAHAPNSDDKDAPKTVRAPNHGGNGRKSLRISVKNSLRALQTDYIDILFVHYWDYTVSIQELMESLNALVVGGKVLYLGASNLPAWVVGAANTYAAAHALTPFSVFQGPWNLLERRLESEHVQMARHFGMALMPWGALGAGKFKSEAEIEAAKKPGSSSRADAGQTDDQKAISVALDKVSHQVSSTLGWKPSTASVALAWIIQKEPRVVPLVGGSSIKHLRANVDALSIRLTRDQVEFLENAVPRLFETLDQIIPGDPAVSGVHLLNDAMAPMAYVPAEHSAFRTY